MQLVNGRAKATRTNRGRLRDQDLQREDVVEDGVTPEQYPMQQGAVATRSEQHRRQGHRPKGAAAGTAVRHG